MLTHEKTAVITDVLFELTNVQWLELGVRGEVKNKTLKKAEGEIINPHIKESRSCESTRVN